MPVSGWIESCISPTLIFFIRIQISWKWRTGTDLCGAAIADYTAFLHIQGKTELLGNAEEGAICLPFLDRVAYDG